MSSDYLERRYDEQQAKADRKADKYDREAAAQVEAYVRSLSTRAVVDDTRNGEPPERPRSGGEPCSHCDHGTVTRRTGPLRWEVQQFRCAFCRGTGQINPEGDA